jgi:hypothetical protein
MRLAWFAWRYQICFLPYRQVINNSLLITLLINSRAGRFLLHANEMPKFRAGISFILQPFISNS